LTTSSLTVETLRGCGWQASAVWRSADPEHEGLLLHSVYHWPNRWDHVPAGQKVACGESCMWGDYHVRELALYLQRVARDEPYLTFFNGIAGGAA
jgi:hypothetical protein